MTDILKINENKQINNDKYIKKKTISGKIPDRKQIKSIAITITKLHEYHHMTARPIFFFRILAFDFVENTSVF